ncbi:MAG: AraC family transcriptional regulator [Propionibacteriaceae bacterium]
MAGPRPTVHRHPSGGYASSTDVVPGAVVSTVGYASAGGPARPPSSQSQPPQVHRGLPSPYLTFIFTLGGPVVSGVTAGLALGTEADRNDVLVAGLHHAPTYVVQPQTQAGIQLAVHPLAARALLGAPTGEVPWQVLEGHDLLGGEVDRVRERLEDTPSWDDRFAILADYLRARVAAHHGRQSPRPELVEAWAWLARHHGAGSMDALAAHVMISPRQLRTWFRAELGVSPKQVSRLMRFDAAKHSIARAVAAGSELGLTEIATRHGYYDHPHLDAEFRQFAGASPSDWVAEERRNIQAGAHGQTQDSSHDRYPDQQHPSQQHPSQHHHDR